MKQTHLPRMLMVVGAVVGLTAFAVSQKQNNAPKRDATEWRLVWADEFDGSALDTSKWSHDIDCWGGGNEERQCYTNTPENIFVKDGHLTIRAVQSSVTGPAWPPSLLGPNEQERVKEVKTQPYSSARIKSKGKGDWRYGKIEVRAKLPTGQGTWPAIWMLPTDEYYGSWALSGEIDILEASNLGAECEECAGGIENNIFGTLHFGGRWPHNRHSGQKTPLEDINGFHTYSIEWRAGEILWFVDGKQYSRKTPEDWFTKSDIAKDNPNAPFDQRFHILLNFAVGGRLAEDHNEGGIDPTGFPKDMVIDFVRVYQEVSGND